MKRILAVFLLIFGLLAAGLGGPASAEPPQPVLQETFDSEIEVDQTREEQYAESFGLPLQEAKRRLKRLEQIQTRIERIVEGEGDRVAGWGVHHEPELHGWVTLAGDEQPTKKTRRIDRRTSDLTVTVGEAHTYDELREAVDDDAVLVSLGSGLIEQIVWTDLDLEENAVILALDENMPQIASDSIPGMRGFVEPMDAAMARTAAERVLEEASDGIDFVIVAGARTTSDEDSSVGLVDGALVGPALQATTHFYGGQVVTNNRGRCTSAFAVSWPNGYVGMLTAGHCGNPNQDPDHDSGPRTLVRHWGNSTNNTGASFAIAPPPTNSIVNPDDGDAMIYFAADPNGPNQFRDDFHKTRQNRNDVRNMKGRKPQKDDFACHYGFKSFKSCGIVTSVDFDPDYERCGWLGCKNQFGKIEGPTLKACNGDSGGPVFANRTAYGIHSGSASAGGDSCTSPVNFTFYTPVGIALRETGATLLTR
jgi:hypothetical protein